MEFITYLDTIIWASAFAVFLIIEISTANLITMWFSGASIVNVFLTLIKTGDKSAIPYLWQIIIFVTLSMLGIAIFYPKMRNKLKKITTNTNVDAMTGKFGVVTQAISPEAYGQIKVDGQIWTARSESSESIAEGQKVVVKSIEGVKAVVALSNN